LGGSRRAATVSVRTARETGKARRLELGGSPTAKLFFDSAFGIDDFYQKRYITFIMKDLLLIIGAGALGGLWHYCMRLSKKIDLLQTVPERIADLEKPLNHNYSYRLAVSVEPDWMAILGKITSEHKIELESYIKEMKKDLEINDEFCLAGKKFGFTSFYSGLTNQELIWSDYFKCFVKDFDINGRMFDNENRILWSFLDGKYKDSPFSKVIKISPWGIGFDLDEFLFPKETMSEIPFELLGTFFLKVGLETGASNWIVKRFPEKIEKKLSESNIKYEAWIDSTIDHGNNQSLLEKNGEVLKDGITESSWLNRNGVELFRERTRGHGFIGQYCSIFISLEVTVQALERENCVGSLPTFWLEELN